MALFAAAKRRSHAAVTNSDHLREIARLSANYRSAIARSGVIGQAQEEEAGA
jgi:hypothetical protein